MEAVSAIALSLALGAGAIAGEELVSEAVKDAYGKLKELIGKRFPKASVQAIEDRPQSRHRRDELAEDLASNRADEDAEIVDKARQLIEAVRAEAPKALAAIAVDLEHVEAANLILERIQSSGGAVRVKDSKFTGDITVKDIKVVSGHETKSGLAKRDALASAPAEDFHDLPPVFQFQSVEVGGSIAISNVQIEIYRTQINQLRKARWRDLEQVNYAVISDSDAARQQFVSDICAALRESFGERSERFSVILALVERTEGPDSLYVYALASPRAKFAAALRERRTHFVKAAIAARKDTAASLKKQLADLARSEMEQWEGWSFDVGIEFSEHPSALEIFYDPETKLVRMKTADSYSLNPADYPDHLKTTSEILRFIAASFRRSIGFFGDIGWLRDDYRLMKVMMRILDHEPIDLGALRINIDEPEEWDYTNPSFDNEIGPVLADRR